jgi:hypothetical protein
MGVRITSIEGKVALYDSVSMTAFGPVFDDDMDAEDFLGYVEKHTNGADLRALPHERIEELHSAWQDEVEAEQEEV